MLTPSTQPVARSRYKCSRESVERKGVGVSILAVFLQGVSQRSFVEVGLGVTWCAVSNQPKGRNLCVCSYNLHPPGVPQPTHGTTYQGLRVLCVPAPPGVSLPVLVCGARPDERKWRTRELWPRLAS